MEKLIYFWKGYIKIRIRGEQTERFLNLCRGRNICVRKLLRHPDGELTGSLQSEISSFLDRFIVRPGSEYILSKNMEYPSFLQK